MWESKGEEERCEEKEGMRERCEGCVGKGEVVGMELWRNEREDPQKGPDVQDGTH